MTATTRAVDALTTKAPAVDPIRTLLRGAVLVLETAAAEHLPTPHQVTIDGDTIQITLGTEDAFNTWATWLDARVDPYRLDQDTVYYSARTTVFNVPVVAQWNDLGSWSA